MFALGVRYLNGFVAASETDARERHREGAADHSEERTVRDAILDQDPVLLEIVERLVAEIRPCRIYLFGSRARGDVGSDSDYDLLLLVEHPAEPTYRLSQRAYRALRGVPAAVDVLVWDRAAFESRLHLPASFPATVAREGRVLHAA